MGVMRGEILRTEAGSGIRRVAGAPKSLVWACHVRWLEASWVGVIAEWKVFAVGWRMWGQAVVSLVAWGESPEASAAGEVADGG